MKTRPVTYGNDAQASAHCPRTLKDLRGLFVGGMMGVALCWACSAPLWVPLVFLAFAVGRRRFSMWLLFALLTAEAVSTAAAIWAYHVMMTG
jgi:hypothetical protein